MTRDDIQRIMDEVPGLNDHGIGVYEVQQKTPEERKNELAEGKRILLDHVDDCNKTCEWLQQIDKIKTINGRHGSYGLKDVAEKDVGYITNGIFIAAAIHCGFPYRIRPGSPNVTFGMSERSIKAAIRRQTQKRK